MKAGKEVARLKPCERKGGGGGRDPQEATWTHGGAIRMKPGLPRVREGFLEKLAHRLRPEGWVGLLSLEWGPGEGAGLGDAKGSWGHSGCKGAGDTLREVSRRHETCRAEFREVVRVGAGFGVRKETGVCNGGVPRGHGTLS